MAVRREAEPVAADDGRLFFGGHELAAPTLEVGGFVPLGPDPLRRHPENVPARHIDIARNPHEDEERPGSLEGVCAHVDPVAPLDARGLRCCKGPRRATDQGRADARYGRCPFRREGPDVVGQAVETESVFFHKFVVIEVFTDNDVYHGKGQRTFTARPQLKPVIGLLGRPDAPRVYDDYLFCLLERPFEHCPAHAVGRSRLRVVAAPVHDARGHLVPKAVNVGDGKGAYGDAAGNHPREEAIVAGRHKIGGAEGVSEAVGILGVGPPRALGQGEILGPRFPAHAVESFRYL